MARPFDLRLALSPLLFLVTLVIAFVAWFTAFIGQAVTEAQSDIARGSAVGVGWFAIFLELFLIVGVVITLGTDSIAASRFQLAAFLAVALVFSVSLTNTSIYSTLRSQQAIGAGYLLLSFVNIIWLLYFTTEADTLLAHLFSLTSAPPPPATSFSATGGKRTSSTNGFASKPARASSVRSGYDSHSHSHHLDGGLASTYGGTTVGGASAVGGPNGYAVGGAGPGAQSLGGPPSSHATGTHVNEPLMAGAGPEEDLPKARALYAYTASADDPNEISFAKGEVMLVLDSSGKWWRVKKMDGKQDEGIAPSNYLAMA